MVRILFPVKSCSGPRLAPVLSEREREREREGERERERVSQSQSDFTGLTGRGRQTCAGDTLKRK
jgi:hypothetical protein